MSRSMGRSSAEFPKVISAYRLHLAPALLHGSCNADTYRNIGSNTPLTAVM
jgi:hypothetical protein